MEICDCGTELEYVLMSTDADGNRQEWETTVINVDIRRAKNGNVMW